MSHDLSKLDPSKIDPTKYPAAVPPPGVVPNLVNPVSRAHATIIFNAVFTAFMLVFVVMRMYTKAFVVKQFGWDDFCCAMGTMLAVAYVGFIIFVFDQGLGAHQWDTPIAVFLNNNTFRILQTIYDIHGVTVTFAKLSILLLYFRLFKVYRTLRVMIHIGIWSTILLHGIATITAMALCTKPTALEYVKCAGTTTTVALVTSAGNAASDVYILAIPIMAVWRLHMDIKRKIGVMAVFSAGLLACGAGIAGLVVRVLQQKHLDDITWWLSPLMICTVLELHIGLIVSCLPILPRLVKQVQSSSSYASWRSWVQSTRSDSSISSGSEKKSNSMDSEKE
ncbi:hypothetical protein P154DRAFT_498471 [Amniculicola lignicola CBS 123094]|uniref:Rhodopsin domain-containing protein n=1 Tax=Amniculicola lignicola CBS 123094 TaxID=1392246 RepID=A0A6A5W6Q1_9PLEO|nr:hypothetical protein P154DRAFT_498471 [Amniculicola lignicola CBS 123094]